MSKRLWSGTFTAFVCTAGLVLSAQTYPSSQNPSSSEKDKDKGQTVTVTGCVARASQSPIGTSGTSTGTSTNPSGMSSGSSRSANEKFVLTNVVAGTSGTESTSPSGMSTANTYRLDGDDSKLSPHVGHKVEITGRVASSAPSAPPAAEPGSANPSEPGANPSAAGASSNAPKLKVESVRMISPSCPE